LGTEGISDGARGWGERVGDEGVRANGLGEIADGIGVGHVTGSGNLGSGRRAASTSVTYAVSGRNGGHGVGGRAVGVEHWLAIEPAE